MGRFDPKSTSGRAPKIANFGPKNCQNSFSQKRSLTFWKGKRGKFRPIGARFKGQGWSWAQSRSGFQFGPNPPPNGNSANQYACTYAGEGCRLLHASSHNMNKPQQASKQARHKRKLLQRRLWPETLGLPLPIGGLPKPWFSAPDRPPTPRRGDPN